MPVRFLPVIPDLQLFILLADRIKVGTTIFLNHGKRWDTQTEGSLSTLYLRFIFAYYLQQISYRKTAYVLTAIYKNLPFTHTIIGQNSGFDQSWHYLSTP